MYLSSTVDKLDGPKNDVVKFQELLSSDGGFDFPEENICVLIDADATHEAVEAGFQKALLDRIASTNDVVVIYFSGHGSQIDDDSNDESDGKDETLVLHDSRVGGRGDFTDDYMNEWLKKLYDKTPSITLILDSCNSGTGARGGFKRRFVKPAVGTSKLVREGDGTDWAPGLLPRLSVLSAATDGTSAMEEYGVGLFTRALLDVLSSSHRITYAQVARRIPPLLRAAGTPQIAFVQGNWDSFVFQNASRKAPVSWNVKLVSPLTDNTMQIELAGPALPGMGPNAELRIYDGALQGDDLVDLTKAKGLALVNSASAFNASATVAHQPGSSPIAEGDVALLVQPSDAYEAFTLSFRPEGKKGGVSTEVATVLRKAIVSRPEIKDIVKLSDDGEFELSLDQDGSLILRGPAGELRNAIPPSDLKTQAFKLVHNLDLHARQRVFLHLKGEGGGDFVDHETLKVQVLPEAVQTACAAGTWVQALPNQEQVEPECYRTYIRVTVDPALPMPLLIGALVLSADGSIIGLPADGLQEPVQPGALIEFRSKDEPLTAISPYDVQDHILVFGTQTTNPVSWNELTRPALRRKSIAGFGALHRTLDRYTDFRKRGQMSAVESDETTWTMTSIAVRVRQRPGSPGGAEACQPQLCEVRK